MGWNARLRRRDNDKVIVERYHYFTKRGVLHKVRRVAFRRYDIDGPFQVYVRDYKKV